MSEQHTPGPWLQSHRESVTGQWNTQVYDQKGETIATLAWHSKELPDGSIVTDRDANARLMAASPDLLAVLQGILEDTADISDGALAVTVLSEIRASIRAVTAKATGEA